MNVTLPAVLGSPIPGNTAGLYEIQSVRDAGDLAARMTDSYLEHKTVDHHSGSLRFLHRA